MSEQTQIRLSAVAEEFMQFAVFLQQRALTRANEVDQLRAQLAAGQAQEAQPERTPPDDTRPETATGT